MTDLIPTGPSQPANTGGLYTCITCRVAFQSAELQRQHYRTDWHRYNLKRKVAQLVPIAAEQFAERLLAQRTLDKEEQAQATFVAECKLCGKIYSSENAYTQHIKSRKHKETEQRVAKGLQLPAKSASMENTLPESKGDSTATPATKVEPSSADGNTMVTESTSEAEMLRLIDEKIENAPRLTEEECLFCTHKSDTFESNMDHMTKQHSFFIPDLDYLVDLRGLIKYFGEKISVGNVCLYCNGRGRSLHSLEAVRSHMIDKGHTKIAYDTEKDIMELSDFYDFRSSYPNYTGAKDTEENAKDDVEDDVEEDIEGVAALRTLAGSEVSYSEESHELILPSGARIGHRALRRYYKQNIRAPDNRDSVTINRLLTQYAHQGVKRASSECRALELMSNFQRKELFRHQASRQRHDFQTRIGISANRLQTHFREQVPI